MTLANRRAEINKLKRASPSKFKMKEGNRSGLDFVHSKMITEIRAKKTCLEVPSRAPRQSYFFTDTDK